VVVFLFACIFIHNNW